MASYLLVGSDSIVQVLSPTVSEDMQAATIQTIPTGIIATTLLAKADFDAGTAGPLLTDFADAIEVVVSQGKAVGGSGTTSLDASGLQQFFVTFEVAYNPPSAPSGTVTADVDVPVGLLSMEEVPEQGSLVGEAEALVNKAYNNLVKLSEG